MFSTLFLIKLDNIYFLIAEMAQIHRLPILHLDNSPFDKRIFILMGGGEKVTVGGLR